jgi:hypothetical protein
MPGVSSTQSAFPLRPSQVPATTLAYPAPHPSLQPTSSAYRCAPGYPAADRPQGLRGIP